MAATSSSTCGEHVDAPTLLTFLDAITSSDAEVQRHNLAMMQHLSQQPTALMMLLEVLADATSSVSRRIAATTTARRLLAVNPTFISTVEVDGICDALIAIIVDPSTPTSLRSAVSALMASLLRASSSYMPVSGGTCVDAISPLLGVLDERVRAITHFISSQDVNGASCVEMAAVLASLRGIFSILEHVLMESAGITATVAVWKLLAALMAILMRVSMLLCAPHINNNNNNSSKEGSSVVEVMEYGLRTLTMFMEHRSELVEMPHHHHHHRPSDVVDDVDAFIHGLVMEVLGWMHQHLFPYLHHILIHATVDVYHGLSASTLRCITSFLTDILSHSRGGVDEEDVHVVMMEAMELIMQLWSRNSALDDGDDASADAVESSLDFLTSIVSSTSSSSSSSLMRGMHAFAPRLLSHMHALSMLPSYIIHNTSLELTLTTTAEDASTVSCVMHRPQHHRHGAKKLAKKRDDVLGGSACDVDDDDDDDDEGPRSAGVEGLLHDNGARRESIAYLLEALVLHDVWRPMLVPHLLQPAADVCAHDSNTTSFAAMEAAVFLVGNVVEELLQHEDAMVDATPALVAMTSSQHHLIRNNNNNNNNNFSIPFYVRLQFYRFSGRLISGLAQAITTHSTSNDNSNNSHALHLLREVGGISSSVDVLMRGSRAEVNVLALVESLQAQRVLLLACLRGASRCGGGDDDMDDDEEEEDVEYSSDATIGDDDGATNNNTNNNVEVVYALIGMQEHGSIFPDILRALTELISTTQRVEARLVLYATLSEMMPLLHQHLHLHPSSCTSATIAQPLSLVDVPTLQALMELLAHTYIARASVWSQRGSISVEMASILNLLCEVVSGAGASLMPALTWMMDVCVHLLEMYYIYGSRQESSITHSSSSGGAADSSMVGLDVVDACMLGLDLVSASCDALLHRDVGLGEIGMLQPTKRRDVDGLASASTQHHTLREALLRSVDANNALYALTDNGQLPVLPVVCAAIIDGNLQQLHASLQSSLAETTTSATALCCLEDDELMELVERLDITVNLRRACYAVLYDCLFLFPDATALAEKVLQLCLRELHHAVELLHHRTARSCSGGDDHVEDEHAAHLVARYLSANPAAANALLCLSEVLHLRRRALDASSSDEVGTTMMMLAGPQLRHLVSWWMRAICTRGAITDADLRSNLILAVANVAAALLRMPDAHDVAPLMFLQHYLPIAAAHLKSMASSVWEEEEDVWDESAGYEVMQLLDALGVVLPKAITGVERYRAFLAHGHGSRSHEAMHFLRAVATCVEMVVRCAQSGCVRLPHRWRWVVSTGLATSDGLGPLLRPSTRAFVMGV